jgi:flagellar biosynthesis protein FlhF
MAAALAKVKQDLGKNAVILNTRTVRERGWFRWGGKPMVEITASRGYTQLHGAGRPPIIGPGSRMVNPVTEGAVGEMNTADPPSLRKLAGEVSSLTRMVELLLAENRRAHTKDLPQPLYETYRLLVESQVAEDLAGQLINEIKGMVPRTRWQDAEVMHAALTARIAEMIPAGGPLAVTTSGKPYVVALIGPTGVGKTTTIAKLAARHSLGMNQKVGLITIDTYRIAAVDQLKTYAEILNLPLKVVLTPNELSEAVAEFADRDLILIDTAGRSQNDAMRLSQLKLFLDEARTDEVHLVLSTTSQEANLLQAAERFCRLGVDRIIFTKLDEGVGFGVILNVLKRVNRKLSYLTNGQEVPDNIDVGRPEQVAEMIAARPRAAATA